MGEFLAYGGGVAMSWQHLCLVWQLCQETQAVDDLEHRSALEICSSYRILEESVASEGYTLSLAIEGDRTFRVTWGRDDAQLMVAEVYGLAVLEEMTDGWKYVVYLHLIE